jgi:hypothetical protein
MMTEKKTNSLVEVLKNAAKNPRVHNSTAGKIQQAKVKNQVTSNRPTKRAAGRGG